MKNNNISLGNNDICINLTNMLIPGKDKDSIRARSFSQQPFCRNKEKQEEEKPLSINEVLQFNF